MEGHRDVPERVGAMAQIYQGEKLKRLESARAAMAKSLHGMAPVPYRGLKMGDPETFPMAGASKRVNVYEITEIEEAPPLRVIDDPMRPDRLPPPVTESPAFQRAMKAAQEKFAASVAAMPPEAREMRRKLLRGTAIVPPGADPSP